jgi:hypothetical protein
MTPKTQEILDELEAWCDDQDKGGGGNAGEKVSWERLFKLVQKKSAPGLPVNNNLPRNSSYLFRSS